jgi:hypothetical protein
MIDAFGVERENDISKGAFSNAAKKISEFARSRQLANEAGIEFIRHRNNIMRPSKATSNVTSWTKQGLYKDAEIQARYEKHRRATNMKTLRSSKKMPPLMRETPEMLKKRPRGWGG